VTALSQPERQGVTVRASTADGTTEFYVRAGTSAEELLGTLSLHLPGRGQILDSTTLRFAVGRDGEG
jgi:hypothetical protein